MLFVLALLLLASAFFFFFSSPSFPSLPAALFLGLVYRLEDYGGGVFLLHFSENFGRFPIVIVGHFKITNAFDQFSPCRDHLFQ